MSRCINGADSTKRAKQYSAARCWGLSLKLRSWKVMMKGDGEGWVGVVQKRMMDAFLWWCVCLCHGRYTNKCSLPYACLMSHFLCVPVNTVLWGPTSVFNQESGDIFRSWGHFPVSFLELILGLDVRTDWSYCSLLKPYTVWLHFRYLIPYVTKFNLRSLDQGPNALT